MIEIWCFINNFGVACEQFGSCLQKFQLHLVQNLFLSPEHDMPLNFRQQFIKSWKLTTLWAKLLKVEFKLKKTNENFSICYLSLLKYLPSTKSWVPKPLQHLQEGNPEQVQFEQIQAVSLQLYYKRTQSQECSWVFQARFREYFFFRKPLSGWFC